MYCFYITPKEYEQAAENGINACNLENRVRNLGWNKEKSISTEVRNMNTIDSKHVEQAKANGISYNTLINRVTRLGWDIERAVNEKLQDKKKQAKKMREKNRVYPIEFVEQAKTNGISYSTFKHRVRRGWSLERASTQVVMTKREIGLIAKEKYISAAKS